MAAFKAATCLAENVHIKASTADNGEKITIMFDNLAVGLGKGERPLLEEKQSASLAITLDQNDNDIPIKQDIRGSVAIDPGARVALVTYLPDQTILVDFLEGPYPDAKFFRRFNTTWPAGGVYQTNFFLIADRGPNIPDAEVLLSIDALDIQLG